MHYKIGRTNYYLRSGSTKKEKFYIKLFVRRLCSSPFSSLRRRKKLCVKRLVKSNLPWVCGGEQNRGFVCVSFSSLHYAASQPLLSQPQKASRTFTHQSPSIQLLRVQNKSTRRSASTSRVPSTRESRDDRLSSSTLWKFERVPPRSKHISNELEPPQPAKRKNRDAKGATERLMATPGLLLSSPDEFWLIPPDNSTIPKPAVRKNRHVSGTSTEFKLGVTRSATAFPLRPSRSTDRQVRKFSCVNLESPFVVKLTLLYRISF